MRAGRTHVHTQVAQLAARAKHGTWCIKRRASARQPEGKAPPTAGACSWWVEASHLVPVARGGVTVVQQKAAAVDADHAPDAQVLRPAFASRIGGGCMGPLRAHLLRLVLVAGQKPLAACRPRLLLSTRPSLLHMHSVGGI